MKNYEEIAEILSALDDATFNAISGAWYDDEKKCARLLKKIGLTIDEYEAWESDEGFEPVFDDCEEEDDTFDFTFTITKKDANKLMNGGYIDALSYFANILADFDEAWEQEEALNIIDKVMMEKLTSTDEWLRVYSGLMCGIC